jgi:cytochrome c-type biogenesis protein CcmH
MIQFLLFGGLTIAALVLLLVPLLRAQRAGAARGAYDLEVYRDQLRELDADVARGLITPGQRDEAKREIDRRILAIDVSPAAWASLPSSPMARLAFGAVLLVGLPLAAGAIYLGIGSPGMRDEPLAGRQVAAAGAGASEVGDGDIEKMVEGLAARLEKEPNDVTGWVLLGRSLNALGRDDEAVDALRRAVEVSNDDPDVVAMLAEHIVFAAGGFVPPGARQLFQQVRAARPDNPAALYYLGLGEQQDGRPREALVLWEELGKASTPDAPWLPQLRDEIAAAAQAAGEDPAAHLAGIPEPVAPAETAETGMPAAEGGTDEPGPTAEEMEAASQMSAEDQAAMIQTMVAGLAERLEATPDDLDGWQRLGRAYGVLNELDKARGAYANAAALAPDDPVTVQTYAESMIVTAGGSVSPGAEMLFGRLLALQDGNPTALWYLGQAAASAGRKDEARGLWQRLLAVLPENSAEHEQVRQELDRLAAGSQG